MDKGKGQKKFWTFQNQTKTKGELLIYGYIYDISWWDEDVSPPGFAEDLKALGDITELDVRINSGGGSVFAAHAIHSLLKAHPAHVNVYIDGLAASAASVVAMAGDTIYIPTNAMMMIHNPKWGVWGEAKDFEKAIDTLKKVKDGIIAAYLAKTKLTAEELAEIMDAETWMTGAEAVEKGFADELLNTVDVAASLEGSVLNINGQAFDLSSFKNRPKVSSVVAKIPPPAPTPTNNSPGGMKMTLEELKAKHPELYNQIVNQGTADERKRMQAIDELAMPGHEELVNKAKYETGITAEALAVEIVKAEKAKGTQFLENRNTDATSANSVPGASAPQNSEDDAQKLKATLEFIEAGAKGQRGVK